MFVGHAAVAFALVGLGARALGVPRAKAVRVAGFAAVVAVLPDVDMLYALVGFASAGSLDPFAVAESFWAASTVAHRSVTHSLVIALPAAGSIGLVAARGRERLAGLGLLAAIAVAVGLLAGPAVWVGAVAFLGGAAVLGALAARVAIDPWAATIAATVALLSHPFGDLFTGTPPWLAYPVDAHLVGDRVALASDPTLHLLGAFFLELAAIWLGVYAFHRLREERLASYLRPHAVLGGVYALAVLVLPAPTLDVSYHFVFSVTAVGFVGALPEGWAVLERTRRMPQRSWRPALRGLLGEAPPYGREAPTHTGREASLARTRVLTGLAAITVAGVAYAVGYVLIGL